MTKMWKEIKGYSPWKHQLIEDLSCKESFQVRLIQVYIIIFYNDYFCSNNSTTFFVVYIFVRDSAKIIHTSSIE